MPAPTITWSSPSTSPSSRRACAPCCGAASAAPQPALEYRGIRLEPESQQVTFQGTPVNLARKEFLLLHELLAQPGRVLTRDRLQQVLYGWDEEVESNALEVHVHHLRKKLFPELIRTVRGVGYLVDKA